MKKYQKILWIVLTMLLMIAGIVTGNKVYFLATLYAIFIIISEFLNNELLKMKDDEIRVLKVWGNDLVEENAELRSKLSKLEASDE